MPDANKNSTDAVGAVKTSASVVEALKHLGSAGVTELANETGISKSNVHRHLVTLEELGFVLKDQNRYRLSLRFLEYGGEIRERHAQTRLIKPKVGELAERTQEVAQFMIENDGYAVVIYKQSGRKGVSISSRIGSHLPMHQVASGKAMLANMPAERVEDILDKRGISQATDNTITDRDELFDELEQIRERGYAINREESTEGLLAMSVSVSGPDGFIGACALSGPAYRMQEKFESDQVQQTALSIANEIELELNVTNP